MHTLNETPTTHPDVNRLLLDLHGQVSAILGDEMVGFYLYGSLATGGFKAGRSDIDFVVVTQDYLPDTIIKSLEAMHMGLIESGDKWAKKLEGAYVPQELIRRHDPAQQPVPTINEAQFYLARLGSDWIFQRDTLRNDESILSGPSLREMIDPVPAGDLKRAILEIVDAWWAPMLADPSPLQRPGYQPFTVHSMCRMLCTMETGEQINKVEACTWALEALPAKWSSLIEVALAWSEGEEIGSIGHTIGFMQYAIDRCRRTW
jgi:hypothetical protein